jgi:hypothetical protein
MSKIWWNLFGKIWIQNVRDIGFKVISAAENSNKFQKTKVLEGKISWGRGGNTWANSTGHTSCFGMNKERIYAKSLYNVYALLWQICSSYDDYIFIHYTNCLKQDSYHMLLETPSHFIVVCHCKNALNLILKLLICFFKKLLKRKKMFVQISCVHVCDVNCTTN